MIPDHSHNCYLGQLPMLTWISFNSSNLFAFKTATSRIHGSLKEEGFLDALTHYHRDTVN